MQNISRSRFQDSRQRLNYTCISLGFETYVKKGGKVLQLIFLDTRLNILPLNTINEQQKKNVKRPKARLDPNKYSDRANNESHAFSRCTIQIRAITRNLITLTGLVKWNLYTGRVGSSRSEQLRTHFELI